jgi:hypothetical protein
MRNGEMEDSGLRPGENGEGNNDELFDKGVSCNVRSVNLNTLAVNSCVTIALIVYGLYPTY